MKATNFIRLFFLAMIAIYFAGCAIVSNKPDSALLLENPKSEQIAALPRKETALTGKAISYAQTVIADDEETDELSIEEEVNDPHEKVNRFFFSVNRTLDRAAVRPLSKVYGAFVPGPIRLIIRNGLRHLETPGDLINYTLQGNSAQAGRTLKRFVINSTLGLGGAFDVADHLGTPYNPTDFGLTLANWGVAEGSYVVSPILGPGTVRDRLAKIVDTALSPQSYLSVYTDFKFGGVIANGTDIIDRRHRNGELLDNVIFASPDPYITLRSTFLQRRRALASGNVIGAEGMDDALPIIPTAGE